MLRGPGAPLRPTSGARIRDDATMIDLLELIERARPSTYELVLLHDEKGRFANAASLADVLIAKGDVSVGKQPT